MGQHLARDVGVDVVPEGFNKPVVGLVRPEVHRQGQRRAGRQGDVLGVPKLAVRLRPALAVPANLGVGVALSEGREDRLLDRPGILRPVRFAACITSASNASRSM